MANFIPFLKLSTLNEMREKIRAENTLTMLLTIVYICLFFTHIGDKF